MAASGCGDSPEPVDVTPRDLFRTRAPKKAPPVILLVGDSLSISLADTLDGVLNGHGSRLFRLGKVGGGLTRPELLDFPQALPELVRNHRPDVAIFMIGANDAMPLVTADGTRVLFDSTPWKAAYAAAAARLMDMVLAANPKAAIFWVGAPPMADRTLSAALRTVNAALREACRSTPPCRFIDTWETFSDAEDAYTPTARDLSGALIPLRTGDGVHLTDAGARRLAARVISATGDALPIPPSPARDTLFAALTEATPVPQATAAPPPSDEGPRKHVVQRGETLASIARQHGLAPDALRRANKGLDPKKLRPGQTLVLPSGGDGP
nr:GDSL-type esterase/lipase family protein [Desulfolutivibrio sulfodismutans]